MIALYIDEDAMSDALVRGLASHSIDVATVADVGQRGREDAEQLAFAVSRSRALFSYNVADFMRLHQRYMRDGRHHQGIVLVRQGRYNTGELLRRLVRLASETQPEQVVDRLEFLNDWGD